MSLQTHQTLNWQVYWAKIMLNANPTAAHHLMASLIRTIYQMITKHPQNGRSEGISTLLLAGKTYEEAVWAAVEEQYLPAVAVPGHSMEIVYNSAAEPNGPSAPTGNCWNCLSKAMK